MNLDRLCDLLGELSHEINSLRTHLLHSRDTIGREVESGACSAPRQIDCQGVPAAARRDIRYDGFADNMVREAEQYRQYVDQAAERDRLTARVSEALVNQRWSELIQKG